MKNKTKCYALCAMVFLVVTMILATLPTGSCAGAVILTPSTVVAGDTVIVAGTGFSASQAVGIAIGNEVAVVNESHPLASTAGTGPFTAYTNYTPVKPGSYYYHCIVSSDTSVVESDYYDSGDGTMTSSSSYAISPFCNYVTGGFGRSTSSAWDGYTVTFTASYTHYQYGVTPTAGVTTSSAGAFSASITVPANLTAGIYTVTAIDAKGTIATAQLTVSPVGPEGLSIGIVVALTAAVIVSTLFFRKQPKNSKLTPSKTI